MLIKKEDARLTYSPNSCLISEYDHPTKCLSCARAIINGRYPENKRAVNLECEQIYYVISGSGEIHSDKGDFEVQEGDSYHFERREKFWVNGSRLVLVVMNSPRWDKEQYEVVD